MKWFRAQSRAFIFAEFLIGILVLSLLVVVLSRTSLSLQTHHLAKTKQTLTDLKIHNALDVIAQYLSKENQFVFLDSTLSFAGHTFRLINKSLWLDNMLLCDEVLDFDARLLDTQTFSITLCALESSKKSCFKRVGWLHDL